MQMVQVFGEAGGGPALYASNGAVCFSGADGFEAPPPPKKKRMKKGSVQKREGLRTATLHALQKTRHGEMKEGQTGRRK